MFAFQEVDGEEPEEEPREFSSVISGLQANYPPDKLEEISTSFCFICLLHLANEQGLELRHGDDGRIVADGDDGSLEAPRKLWDVTVCPLLHITL